MIAGIVLGWRIRISRLFGQHRLSLGGIAERARARKHVGKGITRGLDFQTLPLSRSNRDIEVVRIRGNARDRSFLAPEFATNDSYSSAVIVGDLGNRTGRNILIARVGHL